MRLQKYMAMCGVAARRKCEEIIASGRVAVEGAVGTVGWGSDGFIDSPGTLLAVHIPHPDARLPNYRDQDNPAPAGAKRRVLAFSRAIRGGDVPPARRRTAVRS